MEQPRFNQFGIVLPSTFIPEFIRSMFKDIMRDAGVLDRYLGEPLNCISESLCGIGLPGTNVQLIEQTHQDKARKSSKKTYYPKGNNSMKIIDDNQLGLRFRLVDGYFNYAMLAYSVAYEADDEKQMKQGEVYKKIGTIVVTLNLGPRWQQVTYYKDCVFESISNTDWKYANMANEAQFDVRVKFANFEVKMLCDGVEIDPAMHYNKNMGN